MRPTNEELKVAFAPGGLTGNDICTALRHLGAGDPKWDWLSQEAAIFIERQAARLQERATERDYHMRVADQLAAEIERLKAVIVSDTHVLLSKRPVAFRYRNEVDEWVLTEDEGKTRYSQDVQGLYARGGK